MKKLFAILFLLIFVVTGCSAIQVKPDSEIVAIQSAASVAGYEVGKNNPQLIGPILTHAQALLEASKGDPVKFNTLIADALPLLLTNVKNPPAIAAISGLLGMVEIKSDLQRQTANMAKIQAAMQGFILGLQMAAPGKVSLRESLRIASEESAREADIACFGVK